MTLLGRRDSHTGSRGKTARLSKWSVAASTTVLVLLLATTGTSPAIGTQGEADPIVSIADVAPEVLNGVAQVTTDENAGEEVIEATVNDVEITVPVDPQDGITMRANSGDIVTLGLPNADGAAEATVEALGVVSYENADGSTTTPFVKSDGSVQVVTTIGHAGAPTEYEYEVGLSGEARLQLADDGSVLIRDSAGGFVAGIAKAWARDANGRDVPTHYEVRENAVVQVVEHRGNEFAYPVVADPWLGAALIGTFNWTQPIPGGYRLNVNPTPWARSWGITPQPLTWVDVGRAGWTELYEKQYATPYGSKALWQSRMNTSMKNQWICHQGFAFADPQWNLERYTPDKGLTGFMNSRCN